MAGVAPPELPDPAVFMRWGEFIKFWGQHVFGVFEYALGLLLLLSVYMKTRSAAATGVAALVMAVLWPSLGGVASVVAAACLAYLVYRALYRAQ